jgi:Pvc16 N-terminal domain/Carboxypeptidase regulatory-like domain
MLPDIHTSLERLLYERGRIPSREVDIRFDLPTKEWVDGLTRPTISFYLFDVRENTTLRRANLESTQHNGRVVKSLAPRRFDLNYLVSAITTNVDDEHRLLWRTLGTLLRFPRLPAELLAEPLRDLEPPVTARVLSASEAVRPLDVWSALGTPPRPAVTYTVAAPVDLGMVFEAPLVLTGTVRFRPVAAGGEPETRVYVGGVVRDGAGAPLEGVTVALEGSATASVTGAEGIYVLSHLPTGTVTLRASRQGRQDKTITLAVPADSYDIILD